MKCAALILQGENRPTRCDEDMYFAGNGAYPYTCEYGLLHPTAPVYINCPANHHVWSVGDENVNPAPQPEA